MISQRPNKTVLIVEPDERVREQLAHDVRGTGYQVVTLGNGVDAIKALDQNPAICGVITADEMQGTNGFQILVHVRDSKHQAWVLFTSHREVTFNQGLTPVTTIRKPVHRTQIPQILGMLESRQPNTVLA